ncbi:Putative ribonuclease H protein At1g65750 [Linum perenne]
MTPPKLNGGEDDWVWGLERTGPFTIRSAYNLICQAENPPDLGIWKVLWSWKGPNRIRLFLWLAVKDKLLTNDGRVRRGLSQEAQCTRCNDGSETISHLLRNCSFAKETWTSLSCFDLAEPSWQLPYVAWMQHYLSSDLSLQFGIVCWFLWKSRNERIFENKVESPSSVACKRQTW